MAFNRFRIVIMIRVILLIVSIVLLAFTIIKKQYIMLDVLLGFLIIYQIYALIYYTEKTNREIVRFFQAIENADFTQTSSIRNLGSSFKELADAFAKVTQRFIQLRSEKEEHFNYLQTVVQHVGIAVLSFTEDGEVELMNDAAKRLLKTPGLKNIKSLEKFDKNLVNELFNLKIGETTLLRIDKESKPMHLSMNATGFKLHGETFKLVSIQNIQSEIERERIGKELEIARHVQETLLPREKPLLPGYDIAGICIPAKEIGGDYFDFIQINNKKLGVVIGDVSGKGVPAAIYMTLTKAIFQSNISDNVSPQQILRNINNFMYKTMEKDSFVTLVYAVLNTEKSIIQITRAGHLPVIHFKASQNEYQFLSPSGIGIGLSSDKIFTENLDIEEVSLKSGDWIIIYTDGFTETRNSVQEEFGEERLIKYIMENLNRSAQEMIDIICQGVHQYSGKSTQHDDMTMVIIKTI